MAARPHNFCTVVPSRSMLGNRPTGKKNASVDGDDKGFATRGACVLGIDKRKKNEKTQNDIFFSSRYKRKTVSSSLLLFVFFFTFHFWARRQKRMQCACVGSQSPGFLGCMTMFHLSYKKVLKGSTSSSNQDRGPVARSSALKGLKCDVCWRFE